MSNEVRELKEHSRWLEDELAYAARLKFEEAEVANLISSLATNN